MLALNIVGLMFHYVSLILTTPYEISENNIWTQRKVRHREVEWVV
jgi:hypothetical protein